MDRLRGMEIFVRIIECGSFSKAAESLDLANATVTSNLRNLEKHLGVTLIQRNTRHLNLTEEGRAFLPKCRAILNAVAEAEANVNVSAKGVAGPLRIEAPFALGHSLLCPAVVEFTRLYPEVSASVTLSNNPQRLIESGTDIAIRMDRVEDADLVGRPIYEAKYIVCAAPEVAENAGLEEPSQLDPQRCLGLFPEGSYTPNAWHFSRNGTVFDLQPEGPVHFNNTQALLHAATVGAGFIYVLDIFTTDFIKQGKLVNVFPEWETSKRIFHAVTVKSRFVSPKVRAFIDFLLEVFDSRRPPVTTQVKIGSTRRNQKPL